MNALHHLAYGGPGGGPGPWILFVPLLWGAVIFALVRTRRRVLGPGGPPWARMRTAERGSVTGRSESVEPGTERLSAVDLLDRRYAEGRMSSEEYRERRTTLDEMRALSATYEEKFGPYTGPAEGPAEGGGDGVTGGSH